jgi:hypothetical protein
VKARASKPKKKRCAHKWSAWTYGGSFKDGSERFCLKCRKVQVS